MSKRDSENSFSSLWMAPGVVGALPLAALLVMAAVVVFGLAARLGYDVLLWQLQQPLFRAPVAWLLCQPHIGGEIGLSLVSNHRLDLSIEKLNLFELVSFALKIFVVEAGTLTVSLIAATAVFRSCRTAIAIARTALACGTPRHD